MNELEEIKSKPQTYSGVHESIYRSTSILDYIMKMVNRGDSKETINDVYNYLTAKQTKPL